jgi:hypothetical protein
MVSRPWPYLQRSSGRTMISSDSRSGRSLAVKVPCANLCREIATCILILFACSCFPPSRIVCFVNTQSARAANRFSIHFAVRSRSAFRLRKEAQDVVSLIHKRRRLMSQTRHHRPRDTVDATPRLLFRCALFFFSLSEISLQQSMRCSVCKNASLLDVLIEKLQVSLCW